MSFSCAVRRRFRLLVAALLLTLAPGLTLRAQLRPSEISAAQSTELPFRLSGRLNVTFGSDEYFGSSTYIRRYTGVTAGHMLYDHKKGFGTNLYYEPALYQVESTRLAVSSFAVLSGYQAAAVDPNSNAAFDQDMGYVLFSQPARNNEWAVFGQETAALTTENRFLALGYAAENFPGDELAFVNAATPYYELEAPGLYETTDYYTESGMSGGPLYVYTSGGGMVVSAVNVAGTSRPDPAYSDVRAITDTETALFTEAEYSHGLVTSGTIRGPASVAAGSTAKYRIGAVFQDGKKEGPDMPRRYGELVLVPTGANAGQVRMTEFKTSKFMVTFSSQLSRGDTVSFQLFRNTVPVSGQTALDTLTVTVQ